MPKPNKQQQIKNIQLDIIKHQFSNFCKHNSKALALIFKALIKGENAAQSNPRLNTQNKSIDSIESSKTNHKTNQESTIHLKELELDIPLPKPPLNIEG